MNSGPEERPQPSGGRAPDEFDAIVAGWAREGSVPQWPDDDLLDALAADTADTADGVAGRTADDTADDTLDDLVIDFDDDFDDERQERSPAPPVEPRTAAPLFTGPREHRAPPAAPEDEHYVPPEPPPLPRLGPPAIVGLVLLALGLILVLVPGWVGVGPAYGLPLGLLSLAAGLGWLVLRLWPDPDGAGPSPDDDGAVL